MRLVSYLISKKCINYIINGSRTRADINFYNDYFLGPSLKMLTPSVKRNFMNCISLLSRNEEEPGNRDTKRRTNAVKGNDTNVSVVDANNKISVMTFSEALKFAKSKNMNLVKIESSRPDRVKYKLVKRTEGFDAVKSKKDPTQRKETKRVILRPEIQHHDVQNKIKQMLKFIEKDIEVLCLLENSDKAEKAKQVISILEDSELHKHFHQRTKSHKNIILHYKKKITESKDKPVEKSDDVDSVKVSEKTN